MLSARNVGEKSLRAQVSAITLMLELSPSAFVASLVSGVIYLRASWTHVDHGLLAEWFLFLVTLLGARFCYFLFIQRQNDQYWATHMSAIKNYIRAGAGLGAFAWGATAYMMNVESLDHFAVSIFVVSGLAAGGIASYCLDRVTLIAFMGAMLAPYVHRLATDQSSHIRQLNILMVFYSLMLFVVARNIGRHKMRGIWLNLENETLIQKLRDASHEIRAPVSSIFGFAELLNSSSEVPATVRHFSQAIHRNSLYLKKLVENILLISALDAKRPEPSYEIVTVEEMAGLVEELFSRPIRDKNLQFRIEVDKTARGQVKLDTLRVQQVLINLVGNAIKFTDRGQVVLRAFQGVDGLLVFRVADSGIGIDTQCGEKVFEPFYRERRNGSQVKEGAGLGLSLSRSLAHAMNGELRLIESRLGQGSVFEFCLPVEWVQ